MNIHATVPVGRNIFSCFPVHVRIAIVPGQGRIPALADLLQDLWTETGGMSVSQDPDFVVEYESPVGGLVHVSYVTHCAHLKNLCCRVVRWGLFDDCRMSQKIDRTRRCFPPERKGERSVRGRSFSLPTLSSPSSDATVYCKAVWSGRVRRFESIGKTVRRCIVQSLGSSEDEGVPGTR